MHFVLHVPSEFPLRYKSYLLDVISDFGDCRVAVFTVGFEATDIDVSLPGNIGVRVQELYADFLLRIRIRRTQGIAAAVSGDRPPGHGVGRAVDQVSTGIKEPIGSFLRG